MCGIWCHISTIPCSCMKPADLQPVSNETHASAKSCFNGDLKTLHNTQNEFISRRGPDESSTRCFRISNSSIYVHLVSHVLWTQGVKVQTQPYGNTDGNKFMLFNGDIYSFKGDTPPEHEERATQLNVEHNSQENDGLKLFNLLEQCENDDERCSVLENLQGPFSFILVDILQGRLWFARDFFGRESLLFSYNENELANEPKTWNISSVSVFKNVTEIPSSGLFCLDMNTNQLILCRYNHIRASVSAQEQDFLTALKNAGIINTEIVSDTQINLQFSTNLTFPNEKVVIENDAVLTALVKEARLTDSAKDFLQQSISHLSSCIDPFIAHLRRSVSRRVHTLPPFCKNCISLQNTVLDSSPKLICEHSKVGVLFSGGLDSTVIAYLAAEALPKGSSLDLINVGFSRDGNYTNIPDRETALASYKMLNERFRPQGKVINLVLVNVGKAEVEELRRERIKYLISPLSSVLDDSVGVCLWFAARGIGELFNDNDGSGTKANYASPIRVVLLGSGADELLGGYSRHRSAYEKSGWKGLRSEMQLDFDRISIRNMGRDNRIVSDHGICPRIPFLDEQVVDFLTAQCDLWVKCCPVNVGPLGSRGSGEKLLLRAVGAKLFGEQYLSLALFPKRAMQFGSKIAKLENTKEKGGDSCQRLL